MITIIHQRDKCIGCNYCVELAPQRWIMSKRDGKAVLIGAKEKNKFWVVKVHDEEEESNRKAASVCPVKIITVK